MIASWMLYSCLVGILIAAAAAAGERILRDRRLPTRWIWCAALTITLSLPVGAFLLTEPPIPPGPGSSVPAASLAQPTAMPAPPLLGRPAPLLARADGALLRGWVAGTTLLGVLLALSLVRLGAARASWRERQLDGTTVLVSADVGPAVVGVFRHRIVLPGWVLARRAEARGLILAHEREHVRARDPLLVAAGVLPVLLLPWHLPLWWLYRRLRLAVEMDCDERVVRSAEPGARARYGRLLLDVGGRRAGVLTLAAPFSDGRSLLGRRIRALSERAPAHPLRRAVALGGAAALLVAGACVVPGPDERPTFTEPGGTETFPAGEAPLTASPTVLNTDEVRRALEREYPSILRDAGIGGTVLVAFHLDEEGRTERVELASPSGHSQLDQAALRVADVFRFSPAYEEGRAGASRIELPVVFQIRRPDAPAGESASDAGPGITVTGTAGTARRREVGIDPSAEPASAAGPGVTVTGTVGGARRREVGAAPQGPVLPRFDDLPLTTELAPPASGEPLLSRAFDDRPVSLTTTEAAALLAGLQRRAGDTVWVRLPVGFRVWP